MNIRKFEQEGDIELAVNLVQKSKGLKRCRDLAQVHAEKAIDAIMMLGKGYTSLFMMYRYLCG
jgi:geranylgeranyl pyrophosphate synthase